MATRTAERWLRWYPGSWRGRYGDELAALIDDQQADGRFGVRARLSLVRGGLVERGRADGLLGDAAAASERIRGGALVVLASWTAFVIGGIGFAKSTEHWRPAMQGPARLAASIGFGAVEASAAVAAGLTVLGALVAAPPVRRLLVDGGWPQLRASVVRTLAIGVVAMAAFAGVVAWAHRLGEAARNGADAAYSVGGLALAVLVTMALASLTATACRAATRAAIPPRSLRIEGVLALGVAASMAVGVAGGAAWWAAVASSPSTFLGDGVMPLPLLGSVGLMAAAAVIGLAGTTRVVSGLRIRTA